MTQRRPALRGVLSLGVVATALTTFVVTPGLSQQNGGRQAVFSLQQSFENIRNPGLDPDEQDESRAVSNTDLSYRLSTGTRRANLSLTLGVRLRGATGDLETGEEEGFEFDRPQLSFQHRYTAPDAVFRTSGSIQRSNVGFIERLDLIEGDDGTIEVPDDLDDLEGSGFRTNTRLSFGADFGSDQPFGWGVSLSNSELTYEDVSGSSLEDSSRTSTSAYGRFDLTPTLSLRTGVSYELRTSESESAEDTVTYDMVFTHRRAGNGALRAGLRLAQPEGREDRWTLFFGGTQEIDGIRSLDFNLGATQETEGETRLTGSLTYDEALTRTLSMSAGLNSGVTDNSDNETVLNTAARVNLSQSLTPLSGLNFGLSYGARENLTENETTTDMSVTVQYVHNLTKDWALSVGATHSWRDETDADMATSDRLFLNLGRSWTGRF